MKIKAELLDTLGIDRALRRIAHEIIENNKGVDNIVLVGIEHGGIPICEHLANNIYNIEKVKVPICSLNITDYRDDRVQGETKTIAFSDQNIQFAQKDVLLCDDVLYTGRSIRAGIEAIFKRGRPKSIQLAVLVDRGHRELPIRADYVGKNVPTSLEENIVVVFDKDYGKKAVIVENK